MGRMGLFRLALVALTAAMLGSAASAVAQSIALVTDVSGRVTAPKPVTILSELAADSRVQLDAGARLVAIYLKSGDEYSFTGPAHVVFAASEPKVMTGANPVKKSNPLGKGGNVTIKPVNVTQAAFVMRSGRPTARIKLLTLSGTRTLETAPEFRWQEIEPGLKYRVEITVDTGISLYESESAGPSVKVPATVQLRDGISYTWEVSTRAADGRRYVSAGDFTVAEPELRKQALALRPAAGAPVSERVAYAAWLEQAELRDEARKYWRALSAERPEDEKLKSLAAE